MCNFRQTYWPNNGVSFALTSRQHVLPCYLRILCLRHNTPYVRWHALHTPPFCKQGLSATVFGRKQTRISRILFSTFVDALPWWKIKSKSTFPVSFSLVSAEMNLVGNYRTLRGLRTVNPEGLPSTSNELRAAANFGKLVKFGDRHQISNLKCL